MHGKESTTRAQAHIHANLAPSSSSPWRPSSSSSSSTRSVSPSPSSADVAAMYSQSSKRSSDSTQSSVSSSSTTNNEHKLARRPVFISTGGKSVAALQQHHQWLAQQQQQQQQSRPRSTRNAPPPLTGLRSPSPAISKSPRRSPVYRDDEEDEEIELIEEEQATGDTSSTRNHGPLTPNVPFNPSPLMSGSQEFKVAREGWIYKKNNLMQWKPVYAVAKHGNAIKPGGLYLYKDDKFSSHIHTYDMSEAIEVEPRAKEYKAGTKWEFRILVKRDDVLLATEDAQGRKEWIDALTSIMGKVSIATHSELQSRTRTAEQYNRDLQAANEELEAENQQLREQLSMIEEDFAKRERTLQSERVAREKALVAEMENMRQTMETKYDLLEHELATWRAKAADRKKHVSHTEAEVRMWRARAEDLEVDMKKNTYHNANRQKEVRFQDEQQQYVEDWKNIKDGLQTLRDQIKSTSDSNPLVQGHILDIKTAVNKLHSNLEEACSGWNELQADIVRFLDTERENQEAPTTVDKLRMDISALRDELMEIPEEEQDDGKNSDNKRLSLSGKFDVLMQMMELLQVTQNRLLIMQETDEESETKSQGGIDKEDFDLAVSTLREKLVAQKTELSEFMEEVRTQPEAMDQKLQEVCKNIQSCLDEFRETGKGAHDHHEKSLKVVGQLFQHVISKIEASAISDLPDLSQQLEDVLNRLTSVERSLVSRGGASVTQDVGTTKASDSDLEDIRELVIGTRGFMERTLRVLDRFGGSHAGMEDTVRRAVKGAFNSHLDVNWQNQGKSREESATAAEEKLKKYEENARGYFDKSMSGMREHLEEYTGVMYKMIEDLVLRAVEHLESGGHKEQGDGYGDSSKDRLQHEIRQLEEERQTLQRTLKDLRHDTGAIEHELAQKKADLQSAQVEYATTLKAGQEHTAALARDLEPLIRQLSKIRQLDLEISDDSENSTGYVDLGKKETPPLVTGRKSPSPPMPTAADSTSKFLKLLNNNNSSGVASSGWRRSDPSDRRRLHQDAPKSPLNGTRPRGTSPFAGL
ncbi:hypothetical protein DFQ28_003432 [Apophysomyces sp. BC1034]|nr:hypothetical protein DFQ28_003432 [Apophysomyces sp. BC1034]